jgi:hypothetical protein
MQKRQASEPEAPEGAQGSKASNARAKAHPPKNQGHRNEWKKLLSPQADSPFVLCAI